MISAAFVCLVLSAISFTLAMFRVPSPVDMTAAGLLFLILSLLLGLLLPH